MENGGRETKDEEQQKKREEKRQCEGDGRKEGIRDEREGREGKKKKVLGQDKMHKHDHMKHQHIKGATQPATSGGDMDEAKLDLRAEKMTNSGHFKVSLSSQATPVKINHMRNWLLVVKGDGGPIKVEKTSLGGGMPRTATGFRRHRVSPRNWGPANIWWKVYALTWEGIGS